MYYLLAIVFTTERLRALASLLEIISHQAEEGGISEKELLDMRLATDMFPLSRQVQIATDNAKGMAARLAGKDIPSYEDTESSVSELTARLEKTIAFLATFSEADFDGAQDREARFPWFPGMHMVGSGYLLSYALLNFMFHVTTTYAILRHHGFQIGKPDFLGTLPLIPDASV